MAGTQNILTVKYQEDREKLFPIRIATESD